MKEKEIKRDFYRLDRILKTGATWNVLLGERANGKSYAAKEYAINEALLEGNITCALIRRLDEDIKASVISAYFNDAGLIEMIKKKPVINREKCIRCFCCQEFCPVGAMKAHKNIIVKILTK